MSHRRLGLWLACGSGCAAQGLPGQPRREAHPGVSAEVLRIARTPTPEPRSEVTRQLRLRYSRHGGPDSHSPRPSDSLTGRPSRSTTFHRPARGLMLLPQCRHSRKWPSSFRVDWNFEAHTARGRLKLTSRGLFGSTSQGMRSPERSGGSRPRKARDARGKRHPCS